MVYICEDCNYSTTRVTNYNLHIKSDKHLNSKIPDLQFKYNCDGCKYKTDKKINYFRHLRCERHLKHLKDSQTFYCKPCDFKTDTLIDYNKHVESKKHQLLHSDKTFICEECDFCTNKKFDYTRHINTKKHKAYSSGSNSDITPSVSVISLDSIQDSILEEYFDENERIPVKNNTSGEIRYASNAPKRKNLKGWLEKHKDWEIHKYTKRATKNEQIFSLLKRVIGLIEENI